MLVDSHCHLDFDNFDKDLMNVIESAKKSGVIAFQTICTRIAQFEKVYSISEIDQSIYCSVGTHPLNVNDEFYDANQIANLCNKPKVIGIGETGLDYYHTQDNDNIKLQHKSFNEHILAAQKTGLPLIIHTRQSDTDLINILKSAYKLKPFKAVLHCFSSDVETAYAALEMNFYISFSGIITFRNADSVKAIAAKIPLNRILIETDSPYLAPHPFRGKRNEPAYIKLIAETLAHIKNETYDNVCKISTNNFCTLFDKAKLNS